MTRRDQIVKWLTYALGLLPVWVLDAYILNRFPLRGVSPTLLPLAVVAVAVLEGAFAGAGFGLGVGLLWALGYPACSGPCSSSWPPSPCCLRWRCPSFCGPWPGPPWSI